MKWPAAKGALYTVVMAGKQSTISNATLPIPLIHLLLMYSYWDHMVPVYALIDTNRSWCSKAWKSYKERMATLACHEHPWQWHLQWRDLCVVHRSSSSKGIHPSPLRHSWYSIILFANYKKLLFVLFSVFKQEGHVTYTGPKIGITSAGRSNTRVRDLIHKYNLGNPVAGNFYFAEWDSYVSKIYSCCACAIRLHRHIQS